MTARPSDPVPLRFRRAQAGLRLRRVVPLIALALARPPAAAFAEPPALPPEEQRFDNSVFRKTLRRFHLRELYNYYLANRPPADDVEAQLFRREMLLERWRDESLPPPQRDAALREALAILEHLIRTQPLHPRHWEWRLQLAQDLLYRQGGPHADRLLYFEDSPPDAAALQPLAQRAADELDALLADLQKRQQRLDEASPGEYRRLLRTGELAAMERTEALAAYHLAWARFYLGMALPPGDPRARDLFREAARYVNYEAGLTLVPHDESGVQAQSLLLTGMAARRAGAFEKARPALQRAIEVVDSLPRADGQDIGWVRTLAHIELVRVYRDRGDWDAARRQWERAFAALDPGEPALRTLVVAAADLWRSVEMAQADEARQAGMPEEHRAHRLAAYDALIKLLRTDPAYEGPVFDLFFRRIAGRQRLEDLDLFELNALIAGLVTRSAPPPARTGIPEPAHTGDSDTSDFRRILAAADLVLRAPPSPLREAIVPYTWYNLAVARARAGHALQAVDAFLQAAAAPRWFTHRDTALRHALALAAKAYADAPSNPDARGRFIAAASAYLDRFPDGAESAHWRLLLAEALQADARYADAASQYAILTAADPHHWRARYGYLACLWEDRRNAPADLAAAAAIRAVISEATRLRRDLDSARNAPDLPPDERSALDLLAARARLVEAQASLHPAIAQYERALALLEEMPEAFASDPALAAHVLQARAFARYRTGDYERAREDLNALAQHDVSRARDLLAGVVADLVARAQAPEPSASPSDKTSDMRDAAAALADDLDNLLRRTSPPGGDDLPIRLTLAEAYLIAGRPDRALPVLEALHERAGITPAVALRIDLARAQALFDLARYAQAAEVYYGVFTATPRGSHAWWTAAIRMLQCHAAVGTDPQRILAIIRQHHRTAGDPPDPRLRLDLARLQREMEQRRDRATTHQP